MLSARQATNYALQSVERRNSSETNPALPPLSVIKDARGPDRARTQCLFVLLQMVVEQPIEPFLQLFSTFNCTDVKQKKSRAVESPRTVTVL